MKNYTNIVAKTNMTRSHPSPSPLKYYSEVEIYITLLVLTCISITTIFGNGMVYIAFAKEKNLRTPTNYLILSLCIADTFVGVFSVNVYSIYVGSNSWLLGATMCVSWLVLDYWVFQASVFGVLTITIDRFLVIKYPLINHTGTRTNLRVKLAILSIWLISFLLWVPPIILFREKIRENVETKKECILPFANDVWFVLLAGIFSYILPVVMMSIIAIYTHRLLVKNKKSFSGKKLSTRIKPGTRTPVTTPQNSEVLNSESTEQAVIYKYSEPIKADDYPGYQDRAKPSFGGWTTVALTVTAGAGITLADIVTPCTGVTNKRIKQLNKISIFVLLMALAFTLTIFPYGILSTLKSIFENVVSERGWRIDYTLGYVNSMLNPICYALGNKKLNKAFKKILCTKCLKYKGNEVRLTSKPRKMKELKLTE